MEQGSTNRDTGEKEEEQLLEEESDNNKATAAVVDNEKEEENSPYTKWDPPFDILRPNCVPAYGPYSIDKFINKEEEDALSSPSPDDEEEEEDMYNTKKSNTPSSSGDSGYGTTAMRSNSSSSVTTSTNNNNNKVQDLFEALFAPVAPPPATKPPPSLKIKSTKTVSHGNTITSSKLSLLFTKKKEPHYVKFQTWSNHHRQSSATITNLSTTLNKNKSNHALPHEENLFRSPQPTITEHEWKHRPDAAPPLMIKVEKEHPKLPPQQQQQQQQRGRRRTDASLALPPPEIVTTPKPQHSRCKSTGSSLDFINKSAAATIDDNILDQYEEGNLIARYVSLDKTHTLHRYILLLVIKN